ncbi:alpha/beta hydrolase [Aquidulcibacter sp.]|uniref:alpha/beta fold hydrolase n=1 Tax=Aquidulcibacter sp. TaxID=2052990 RepID=UPI0025BD1BE9|nr:alpha/beta hydrolase [Aquidulcibacter sp.]
MVEIVETRLVQSVAEGTMAGLKWANSAQRDDAPALVFFHANGFCASTYRQMLRGVAAATGRPVAAFDLRGHGRTRLPDDPDRQDNWNRFARDIAGLLEQITPQGAVLAGHSMGGTSSLLASALRPDLVKGLCLFDPVLAPTPFYVYAHMPWVFRLWRSQFPLAKAAGRRRAVFPNRQAVLEAYSGRGAFKSWPQSMLEDYVEDGFTDLPDGQVRLSCAPAFEAACFAGQRHYPIAALKVLKVPGRLLRGARHSTTVATLIPLLTRCGIDVETVPETSHFLPMEKPDACAKALIDLIHSA